LKARDEDVLDVGAVARIARANFAQRRYQRSGVGPVLEEQLHCRVQLLKHFL
jgi:hypothetical protein